MTLGKTSVEPVMTPVINYVPEKMDEETKETEWWGTCMARWVQLQRHALGFADFSYYFMMLPLVFRALAIRITCVYIYISMIIYVWINYSKPMRYIYIQCEDYQA